MNHLNHLRISTPFDGGRIEQSICLSPLMTHTLPLLHCLLHKNSLTLSLIPTWLTTLLKYLLPNRPHLPFFVTMASNHNLLNNLNINSKINKRNEKFFLTTFLIVAHSEPKFAPSSVNTDIDKLRYIEAFSQIATLLQAPLIHLHHPLPMKFPFNHLRTMSPTKTPITQPSMKNLVQTNKIRLWSTMEMMMMFVPDANNKDTNRKTVIPLCKPSFIVKYALGQNRQHVLILTHLLPGYETCGPV